MKKGQKKRIRTLAQDADRRRICKWVKRYIAEGESSLVYKGPPENTFAALPTSKNLTEGERLRLAVRNRILVLCGDRQITIHKLAARSALSPSSIKNILYGKSHNPKVLTIKMICNGLDITLKEFFSTPEFDALGQNIK